MHTHDRNPHCVHIHHAHTHTLRMHTRTHTHTHTPRMHTHTHTHTHTMHAYSHSYTHTHHACILALTLTHTHTMHAYSHSHSRTHTHTPIHFLSALKLAGPVAERYRGKNEGLQGSSNAYSTTMTPRTATCLTSQQLL